MLVFSQTTLGTTLKSISDHQLLRDQTQTNKYWICAQKSFQSRIIKIQTKGQQNLANVYHYQ